MIGTSCAKSRYCSAPLCFIPISIFVIPVCLCVHPLCIQPTTVYIPTIEPFCCGLFLVEWFDGWNVLKFFRFAFDSKFHLKLVAHFSGNLPLVESPHVVPLPPFYIQNPLKS